MVIIDLFIVVVVLTMTKKVVITDLSILIVVKTTKKKRLFLTDLFTVVIEMITKKLLIQDILPYKF